MTLRRAAALSVGKGVVASYVHSSVDRRPRQDRRDWSRSNPPARGTNSRRSAAWSPCMSRLPIHRLSIRPGSMLPPSSAKKACSPKPRPRASPPRRREDRRVGPQDLLQGSLSARAGLHDRRGKKTVAQAIKESRGQGGGLRSRSRGFVRLCARRRHRQGRRRFRRRSCGSCRRALSVWARSGWWREWRH